MSLGSGSFFSYELRDKLDRLRDWWRNLTIRRKINENPMLVVAVALVSLLVLAAVAVVYFWPAGPKRIEPGDQVWFYDLNTGKLFSAAGSVVAPIESPSGPLPGGKPAGVRAYVLSYAAEPTEADWFIGFLQTSDPNAGSTHPGYGASKWGHNKLIKGVEDENWVPADSAEGRAILEAAFVPNEHGERPRYVQPD